MAAIARVGVSACLLGEKVRYDGGHRRDGFLVDELARQVELVPVCPEVEVGLGVPRDTMRLEGDARAPRLVVERTGRDLTTRMRRFAVRRAAELARLGLDGYVFKRGSPSCGVFAVPVHRARGAPRRGRGLFAAEIARRLPGLPMEEEGRLADPAIRARFLRRVLAAARLRTSGAPKWPPIAPNARSAPAKPWRSSAG